MTFQYKESAGALDLDAPVPWPVNSFEVCRGDVESIVLCRDFQLREMKMWSPGMRLPYGKTWLLF